MNGLELGSERCASGGCEVEEGIRSEDSRGEREIRCALRDVTAGKSISMYLDTFGGGSLAYLTRSSISTGEKRV